MFSAREGAEECTDVVTGMRGTVVKAVGAQHCVPATSEWRLSTLPSQRAATLQLDGGSDWPQVQQVCAKAKFRDLCLTPRPGSADATALLLRLAVEPFGYNRLMRVSNFMETTGLGLVADVSQAIRSMNNLPSRLLTLVYVHDLNA